VTALLICWVVFPLVLGVLCFGCGLGLERLAGIRLPDSLLLPVGLAVVTVLGGLATLTAATAELATPLVIAAAVAGVAVGRPWRQLRVDGWALGCAAAVFLVFGAPVILSGEATFAGYIKLDDTATWLGITDRAMSHGLTASGLAPSSFEAVVSFAHGYPVGSFVPLGVGHVLTGQDIAWLFQPCMAFSAAMLALALWSILNGLVPSKPWRAVTVLVAAQPALLFGYAMWGGIKELAATWVVALLAALVVPLVRAGRTMDAGGERVGRGVRAFLPLAVAAAATVDVFSFGGAVWIGPVAIAIFLLLAAGRRWDLTALQVGGVVVVAAVLGLPALVSASSFLTSPAVSGVTAGGDLGRLVHPLSLAQAFGIWPSGDFRFTPHALTVTSLLIAVAAAGALLGVVWAWARDALAPLLYLATALFGFVVIAVISTPWGDAKAMATTTPAVLLVVLVGALALLASRYRIVGGLVVVAIAAGVVWSNALAYHDVWLAPRAQLVELEHIGDRIAGQGPTLMTEFQPYGVRHFLRASDPEGASELRRRPVFLRDGSEASPGEFVDLDQLALDSIFAYRTIVLRRSPSESRPPPAYRLVYHGHWYDVWQRPPNLGSNAIASLPLGRGLQAGAIPPCGRILALRRGAARLQAAVRAPTISVLLGRLQTPPGWVPEAADPGQVVPHRSGTIAASVLIPATGSYDVWLGGSFRSGLEFSIDGRRLAEARAQLNNDGSYTPMGVETLTSGTHVIELSYAGPDLHPGSGGPAFPLGPLVFSRRVPVPILSVPANRAASLCGKRLDWVMAVGR
jgi:hypothetical protein